MGWTENDKDEEVKKWQQEYGQRKKALALAAQILHNNVHDQAFKDQFRGIRQEDEVVGFRQNYATVLAAFGELHVSGGGYVGGLEGMDIVKKELATNGIKYFKPGDVIENVPGLDGIRIYVLGPPLLIDTVKRETGNLEEVYEHNKKLMENDLLVQAIVGQNNLLEQSSLAPFDASFIKNARDATTSKTYSQEDWRKIDDDWLLGTGTFALRMNSLTNNLSLVLAFEFVETGKVILFPEDAEIGS